MIRGMAAECKEKTGASDAELEEMIDKNLPTTQPGKCLNACMMDQFGIVSSFFVYSLLGSYPKPYVFGIRWPMESLCLKDWLRLPNWLPRMMSKK